MVPCLLQLAPSTPVTITSARVIGAPPFNETFFNFPSAENPTYWPSGEKNGFLAPSVPGIGCASTASKARM